MYMYMYIIPLKSVVYIVSIKSIIYTYLTYLFS